MVLITRLFGRTRVSAQSDSSPGMEYHPLRDSDAHSGNRQLIGSLPVAEAAGFRCGPIRRSLLCLPPSFCSICRRLISFNKLSPWKQKQPEMCDGPVKS